MSPFLPFLLLGHLLGDFVLQSDRLAKGKLNPETRTRSLGVHSLILLACHLGTLALVASLETLWIVLPLVLAHLLIDGVKVELASRGFPALRLFLADQAGHLLCLLVAAPFLAAHEFNGKEHLFLLLHRVAIWSSAWILAWHFGATVVAMTLEQVRTPEGSEEAPLFGDPKLGRTIGILERLLLVALTMQGAWAGIGLILTAKSVARFSELEDRKFSEYYLVGTLTSVLVAVLAGLGLRWMLIPVGITWPL